MHSFLWCLFHLPVQLRRGAGGGSSRLEAASVLLPQGEEDGFHGGEHHTARHLIHWPLPLRLGQLRREETHTCEFVCLFLQLAVEFVCLFLQLAVVCVFVSAACS